MDHMQTICTSLQTDNHTNTPSLNFYRPDALPDAQPCQSTEGTTQKNKHTANGVSRLGMPVIYYVLNADGTMH